MLIINCLLGRVTSQLGHNTTKKLPETLPHSPYILPVQTNKADTLLNLEANNNEQHQKKKMMTNKKGKRKKRKERMLKVKSRLITTLDFAGWMRTAMNSPPERFELSPPKGLA